MKKFTKALFANFFITIAVIGSIYLLNKTLILAYNPFHLNQTNHIVILGDSHTQYAINDIFLKNTSNFSSSADSYFYSYLKLKSLLKENKNIDTIYLSIAQHNIHKSIEQRWLLNSGHLQERLQKYSPFLELEDFVFLSKNSPLDSFKGLFNQIIFPLHFLRGPISYGGYQELNRNVLQEEIAKYKSEGKEEYNYFELSELEKSYLLKIKDFSKSNNLSLVLINTPKHKALRGKQKGLYDFYDKYMSDIPFLDYSQLEFGDEFFADLVHLNPIGAKKFSEILGVNMFDNNYLRF